MQYRVTVNAFIFNREGKILICRQPEGRGVFPGQWAVPGGGIDEGETMTEALKREIKEEVGLEIGDIKPLFFSDDVREKFKDGEKTSDVYMIYLRFTCRTESTEVRLNKEHDDYVWVTREEIRKYNLNKPTIESLKYLEW
ncbi:nucleoside triphosphatase NudI [Patescibacteria group bacterium]